MTLINAVPRILRDIVLTFGTNDYAAQVDTAVMQPQSNTVTWRGLSPGAQHSQQTTATWTLQIAGVADHETAESLTRYLFDNEGMDVAVVFAPQNGIGREYAATVTLTPTTIGGTAEEYEKFTVTLGMKGRPVPADQAP